MQRTYIKDLKEHIGEEVLISGWVNVVRDQGKMIFFDIRDVSGVVQAVVLSGNEALIREAKEVRTEWVLEIKGKVNKRPERMINLKVENGNIELEISSIEILSQAHELPFELGSETNLDIYLDYLPFTLREEKIKNIFKLQASILEAYRESLRSQGFVEFMCPILAGADAEGGATAFSVNYYYDHKVYLATSPQFYKQIMVGIFERAFTISKIFRGEKHATTRHLSEVTQMDFEMGFIRDHLEPMAVLEKTVKDSVAYVVDKHTDVLQEFEAEKPLVPAKFPILKLREVQDILGIAYAPDLEPEHERQICEWSKKEYKSDFVFVTHFPTAKRAFYTYADPDNQEFSRSFDLLFRGLEINSGSQRIHDYRMLVEKIKSRGLDPAKFSFYLQAFKYAMPPHGGSSTGLERFTMKMLNLQNVKEATLFPRDMNRIDIRLSE